MARTTRDGKAQAPSSAWIYPPRRKAIYIRDNYRCQYCSVDVSGDDAQFRTLDHIVSCEEYEAQTDEWKVWFGSRHKSSNLATCCKPCNTRRKSTPWMLFASEYNGAFERINKIVKAEFALNIKAGKKAAGNKRKSYANCWKAVNSRRLSQGVGTK